MFSKRWLESKMVTKLQGETMRQRVASGKYYFKMAGVLADVWFTERSSPQWYRGISETRFSATTWLCHSFIISICYQRYDCRCNVNTFKFLLLIIPSFLSFRYSKSYFVKLLYIWTVTFIVFFLNFLEFLINFICEGRNECVFIISLR